MSDQSTQGPFKLITVNTAPERAKRLIGRMAEMLKDRYIIQHVDNCESTSSQTLHTQSILTSFTLYESNQSRSVGIDEVEEKVREYQPDLLVRLQHPPPSTLSYPTCLLLLS